MQEDDAAAFIHQMLVSKLEHNEAALHAKEDLIGEIATEMLDFNGKPDPAPYLRELQARVGDDAFYRLVAELAAWWGFKGKQQ